MKQRCARASSSYINLASKVCEEMCPPISAIVWVSRTELFLNRVKVLYRIFARARALANFRVKQAAAALIKNLFGNLLDV